MNTKLLEFKNKKNDILRGVFVSADETKKDYIVVMLGGFERAATTERKFKALADKLTQKNIDSFRFDVADVGLSDGNFYHSTTQSFADDLSSAIACVKELGYQKISFVGHSHAACAFSLIPNKTEMERVVLLAPGLNQQGLFRMWFVQGTHPEVKADWSNYREYLNENEYQKSVSEKPVWASRRLSDELEKQNSHIDYADNYKEFPMEKILIVHGTTDSICPYESVNIHSPHTILVEGGDHDLEKPAMITQWLDSAVAHLSLT